MIRQVAVLALERGAPADRVAALEQAIEGLPERVPSVRRVHLGRNLRGSIGGDLTWDALVARGADLVSAEEGLIRDAGLARALKECVASVEAVRFAPAERRIDEPGLRDGVKRTLLLRVVPGTPGAVVERFEADLRAMPRHIGSIRNWALSRADPALLATPWTHVWEQEYRDPEGLTVDYMNHPYHWGWVDGYFDPESPRCCVEQRLVHVFCPTARTILGWSEALSRE